MTARDDRRYRAAAYIDGLIENAGKLHRDAESAFAVGDHEQAEELLVQAELLASDITECVDEFEQRQLVEECDYILSLSPEQMSRTERAITLGIGASLAAGALILVN